MISIANGLRISVTNLEALKSGKIVGAFSKTFLALDKCFALYPDIQVQDSETINVEFWAECKNCESIDSTFPLSNLSQLTALSIEELESIFQQRANIFLLSLRVYQLPNSIQVQPQATGNFVPLSEAVTIVERIPILNDEQFQEAQKPFQSIDLSVIPNEISTASIMADEFLEINPSFLDGFIGVEPNTTSDGDLVDENSSELPNETEQQKIESTIHLNWFDRIAAVGNSSGGHEFEKLVRKSFIELGFSNSNTNPKASLDPEATGGAGGIDLCCEYPYPVIGECKASANGKIPTDVCSQLIYLGQAHFQKEYEKAIKLIIAAGSLNHHSNPVAIGNRMNVIRPETLEKIVKLKISYVGSINLRELKSCLEKEPFGEEANSKLLEFIEKSELEIKPKIKLRSHIVQTVKEEQDDNQYLSVTEIRSTYNAKYVTDPKQKLSDPIVRDLLIELSSPLVGYLGRVEEDGKKCDRFYYLRDLPI
jgi:Domain of unknown function (DUF1802)